MKKLFTIGFVFILGLSVKAQNINPAEDLLFRMNDLTTIELTMDPADVAALLDNIDVESNTYYHASIRIINSQIDSIRSDVGVRLRGNTSRYKEKKSIKIDFKEWGGAKFENYKKLNIKAETNDVSMAREMLSLYVFRTYNVPAARTFHVRLYINGEYKGLYLNVEQIDDEFVDRRYDTEAGNLYKCYWGANLSSTGDVYDDGKYTLKTNELVNDRSKLTNLISVLKSSSTSSLPGNLEPIFEVSNYLRYMAVESILGHWDGYSYNQNNFYLYENPTSAKIHFIPYDLDNTFGIDYLGPDWGTRDVTDWSNDNFNIPLTQKVLQVDDYFESYCRHMVTVLRDVFNEETLFPILDNTMNVIKNSVEEDPLFSADNGYSYSDYIDSYENAWGGHLVYGVKEYIRTRSSKALIQLTGYTAYDSNTNTLVERIESSLLVFPNPVKEGYFFVKANENTVLEDIKLYDYLGRTIDVNYFEVGHGEYRLIFDEDPIPGMYILRIGKQHSKILVE